MQHKLGDIAPDFTARTTGLMIICSMMTGRTYDEVLRSTDSLQLAAEYQVPTPVDRKTGGDVIIAHTISDEIARMRYPIRWNASKPCLRSVPQPAA